MPVQNNYVAETVRALGDVDHDPARSLLADDEDARREVALAEYAGVVPSHPPEHAADCLFRSRRTAIAGEWKLDAVGDDRPARRIDWAEHKMKSAAPDAIPPRTRNKL